MADDHVPLDYFDFGSEGEGAANKVDAKAKATSEKKAKKTKAPPTLFSLDTSSARDFILGQYRQDNADLSSLELAELEKDLSLNRVLPGKATIKQGIESSKLPSSILIGVLVPSYEKLISDKKCKILILCESARRCVDVLKEIAQVRGYKRAGKLFAKHIKIDEQINFLKKSGCGLAIGTPGRILSLEEKEEGILSGVTHILIDGHRDLKTRSIFDMKEVREPLLRILLKSFKETTIGFAGN